MWLIPLLNCKRELMTFPKPNQGPMLPNPLLSFPLSSIFFQDEPFAVPSSVGHAELFCLDTQALFLLKW